MDYTIKKLSASEIASDFLDGFDRRQEVKRCLRKVDGEWVLRDIPFVDDWTPGEKKKVAGALRRSAENGRAVLAAFDDGSGDLLGFASLAGELFGERSRYIVLAYLHVSNEARGRGIGRVLFTSMVEEAKKTGADKMYMSTHSAEESQAFYSAVGCVDAEEINEELLAIEPFDRQMEFAL